MKKIITISTLICLCFNLHSQTKFLNVTESQLNTYKQRIKTQGSTPSQTRLNYYTDKINYFLEANFWKGDQVISIKELKIMPPDDPGDWYYFVSIKTKLCSTPFYSNYDIGDSFMGEYFGFELRALPIEFSKHIENEKAKLVSDAKAIEDKQNAERENLISENKKALPEIIKKYSLATNQDKLASVSTMRISGKEEDVKFEILKQKPNKLKIISTWSNGYQEIQCFDGEKGYIVKPTSTSPEPKEMTVAELNAIQNQIKKDDFYGNYLDNLLSNERLIYNEIKYINNRPTYQLRDSFVDENSMTYMYYVDTINFRILKIEAFFDGYLQWNDEFSNFTKTHDILMPLLKTIYPTRGQTKYSKIDKVEIDIPFKEGEFNVFNKYNDKGEVIDSKELRNNYALLGDTIKSLEDSIIHLYSKLLLLTETDFCLTLGMQGMELENKCYERKNTTIYLAIQVLYNSFNALWDNDLRKNQRLFGDIYFDDNDNLNSMDSYVDKNSYMKKWIYYDESIIKTINEYYAAALIFKSILSSPEEIQTYNKTLKNKTNYTEIKSIIGL